MKRLIVVGLLGTLLAAARPPEVKHTVLVHGKGRLAIVDGDGKITWEMKWGGIHDIHMLENGHIMVQQGMKKVVEIDPKTKKVVWSYDSTKMNGNEGKRVDSVRVACNSSGDVSIGS